MSQYNFKIFKRDCARYIFYFFRMLFRFLPYWFVKAMTATLTTIAFEFVRSKRKIAQESIDLAFGESLSQKEKKRIIKQCFVHIGRGMIEVLYFSSRPQMIKDRVFFEGKEHLDRILQEGKGAILVSAHFGNFPIMLLRLVQMGYKVSAIMRPFRDEIIEKDFIEMRESFGLKAIYSHPRTECVKQSLKALRTNELLFIPLDQNTGTKGSVFVNFFGRPAATATGPAVFAMRAGSPIIPIFAMRDHDDVHRVVIEPPLYIDTKENDEETILNCISQITGIIERFIRRYPQEWGWMHRRWKTQPKDFEQEKE